MKTQREKFEEWAINHKNHHNLPVFVFYKDGDGNYIDADAKLTWRAWQAAIDSVVVELPEPHEDEWHELNFTVSETKEAIEKAGIKHE